MAGLSLGINSGVQSALPPSSAASTIGQRAYGVNAGASPDGGPATAGVGVLVAAVASTALLVWLWWSLPS